MARTKISEFSATPGDNTDIDGIDIAEGCAPSGINNAIRELMAQLKDMQTGASGDTFTLTTVNSTTVDTTNLEATNLKAKDGTAAGSIANSTGVVTLGSSVLTTTDINGGTVDGTTIGATTPSTVVATQVDITAQGDLRLQDTTGGQYVALQAPSTIASSYTLTLPVDDGTSGQALITDGSGVLSWSSAASGDVYGPASATDNAVARYDGTTGKIIQNSAVTIADDGATVIAANSTSDGLRITQIGTGNALVVEDEANPDSSPFVIDNAGRILAGQTVSYLFNDYAGNSRRSQFQFSGTNLFSSMFSITNWSAVSTSPSSLNLAKSRGAAVGTQAIVVNNDDIGVIEFSADDGTTFIPAASILAEVDGTPGTNDMPGRLVFSTTADGASSPTERMRIDSAGRIGVGTSTLTGYGIRTAQNITGAVISQGIGLTATVQSDVTTSARGVWSNLGTQATAFSLNNLVHFYSQQGTIGAGSTVTNQFGFAADSGLTGATNNYGFHSSIASGTGRFNFYAAGTAANVFAGTTSIGGVVGAESLRVTPTASGVNFFTIAGSATTGAPTLNAQGSDTNIGAGYISKGTGTHFFATGGSGGNVQFNIAHTASAVNYLQVTGSATGNSATLSAQGSDANIGLLVQAKGTGAVRIACPTTNFVFSTVSGTDFTNYFTQTGSLSYVAAGGSTNITLNFEAKGTGNVNLRTGGALQFQVAHTASAVNCLQVTGGATGNAVTMSATGSDTNIDLALTPKGTGVLAFGTYTAGVVVQAGYITIKDAAGNTRNLLVG